MQENDVILIHQINAGDDTAFVSLVEKYQKQVHALAWRKIGDFHIAEEITQDTFLKVYQKLSTLRDPNQFAGWLYVIANRQCLAWLRKKRIETESLEDTDTEWIDETTYSRYVAEEQAKVTAETQREVVKRLLSKLKESERTVMTLYYLGEMTTEEISQFLGVSTSAIKLRLHRARQRLQKEETMIREALSNFQLSPNLTDNIMQKVEHIKPAVPSGSKPLVPWAVAASTLVVVLLMLGIGNHKYLTRFQQLYSLDATSEMTVEIIDAPIVANLESKPDVWTQIGSVNALDKQNSPDLQPNDASAAIAEAQGDEIVEDWTKWELPKEAKARFGKGGVNMLQFSPDGRQLAVGSSIGVWLYDAKTGKEVVMFPGKCRSIAFSPDGRFLANSVGGQGPRLWEVATNRKMERTGYFPSASALRFSEDGKTLFALGDEGDSISQLDVETGKGNVKDIEEQTSGGSIFLSALTHDKFAVVEKRNEIELWDTTTREILSTLKTDMTVLVLEFSPDGTRLASAGRSIDSKVTLQLWDTESREQLWDAESKETFQPKHTGWVNALAFSPDGKMLASGGSNKMVQLWDSTTGKLLTTLAGHNNGITALTFSPDNRTLASGSADGTVRFWNINTGEPLPTHIDQHTIDMEAVAFFKDNATLASVTDDGVISLWDVKTLQKTSWNTLRKTDFYHKRDQGIEYQYWLSTSAFSPDGTKIVSAGAKGHRLFSEFAMSEWTDDQTMRLSDVRTGHELQTLATAGSPSSVTFSPDGKTVAFGNSGKIRVWNTETGDNFDISLDMESLDISHFDQNDIDKFSHRQKSEISAYTPVISALVFSPDGEKLISGTKGGKVQMWDAKTGVPLTRLFVGEPPKVKGTPPKISIAYQEHIRTLAFSPNGNLIAIASNKRIHLLRCLAGHKHILLKEIPHSAEALVFSPDKTSLVIGRNNSKIELWNLETEDKPTALDGHTATVQTLVFSPDGKTLVSTGQDGTILLWDWNEALKGSNREKK